MFFSWERCPVLFLLSTSPPPHHFLGGWEVKGSDCERSEDPDEVGLCSPPWNCQVEAIFHGHCWLRWLRISVPCGRPGFDPWVGRIPGGEHGNWLHCSCLENPMDRGAWRGCSAWGCRESDRTEQPVLSYFHALIPGMLRRSGNGQFSKIPHHSSLSL